MADDRPKILEELERGRYDLVVLGSRGRLRFRSRLPLLSVPADE
jgi:nucleotide-binding universal stress UspA family protein